MAHRPRIALIVTLLALTIPSSDPCFGAHWHVPSPLRRFLRRERWVDLKERTHRPAPSPEGRRDGFILFSRDPLERIYLTSRPRPQDRVEALELVAAQDQYEPMQVALYATRDLDGVSVTASDLHDDAGNVLPASAVTVRMVRFYGAALSSRRRDRFGVVPKTLEIAVPLPVPRGTVRPYWITVYVPSGQPGGVYRGVVRISHSGGGRELPLVVEVLPLRLHEPDILYATLSINPLAQISRALARSRSLLFGRTIEEDIHLAGADALLQRAELMLRDQRAHGMNTISPWSAKEYAERQGAPYVRDLEVGMLLHRRVGFTQPMLYQMGTLLHSNKKNRAGSYREFVPDRDLLVASAIAQSYTARFARAGLPGIIFLPIEEPNLGDGIAVLDPPDIRQRIGRDLLRAIKESGGRTGMTCTPESAAAVGAQADYWIVAHRRFTANVYAAAARAGAHLAIYANAAIMGQNTYAPRFFFGYFVWANGLKGMLPWTYPIQPNRFPINVRGRGEGPLNVHDRFLGLDGAPVPTIQWELSRMGIDDAKYLATVEALAAAAETAESADARAAAADAHAFLAEVRGRVRPDAQQYLFENPHTFEPQPEGEWDAPRFKATRAQAVALLKRLLATDRPAS